MRYNPHGYQVKATERILHQKKVGLFLDMGLGKTVISLTAIADLLFDSFEAHRVLVVAPLRVARDTWPAEIEKWAHLQDLTYTVDNVQQDEASLLAKSEGYVKVDGEVYDDGAVVSLATIYINSAWDGSTP